MKGAWVTLATNDSYSLGALVLAHSLKQVGTTQELAILVTPGVTNSMRTRLSQVFNLVQEVNVLDSRDKANLRLLQRPELGVTFTKLHCWQLTQFEKCVFLDADTLVLQNCDELFQREELSAAPDVGWPDCFNSGVFVYKPSTQTYNNLIQFALDKGSFDGGDQGLLNLYFSDWAHKDIGKHLPFIYNVCSTAFYSYLPAFKQFGKDIKIIHFIGTAKPWLQYFDTETRKVRPSRENGHLEAILQKWWDIFCHMIHPNLTSEMSGLAGAFSKLTLGQQRSPEQEALEDSLRRQNWEQGNIDYLGRDSFDNIWSKICETLAKGPQEPEAVESQRSEELQAVEQQQPQAEESTQSASLGTEALKEQTTAQVADVSPNLPESVSTAESSAPTSKESPLVPVESQKVIVEEGTTVTVPSEPDVTTTTQDSAPVCDLPVSAVPQQVPISKADEVSPTPVQSVAVPTDSVECSAEKICSLPTPKEQLVSVPTDAIEASTETTAAIPPTAAPNSAPTAPIPETQPTISTPAVPLCSSQVPDKSDGDTKPSDTTCPIKPKTPSAEAQTKTVTEIPVSTQSETPQTESIQKPAETSLISSALPTNVVPAPPTDLTTTSPKSVPSTEKIEVIPKTQTASAPAPKEKSAEVPSAETVEITSKTQTTSEPVAKDKSAEVPPTEKVEEISKKQTASESSPKGKAADSGSVATPQPVDPSVVTKAPSTQKILSESSQTTPKLPEKLESSSPSAPLPTQAVSPPKQISTPPGSVPQSTTPAVPIPSPVVQTPTQQVSSEPAKEPSASSASADTCPIVPPPRKSGGNKKQSKSKK